MSLGIYNVFWIVPVTFLLYLRYKKKVEVPRWLTILSIIFFLISIPYNIFVILYRYKWGILGFHIFWITSVISLLYFKYKEGIVLRWLVILLMLLFLMSFTGCGIGIWALSDF